MVIRKTWLWALFAYLLVVVACATQQAPRSGELHRWWAGLGPVLPHDSFPADCSVCHVGQDWNSLIPTFEFDHERETGVKLEGAHDRARCLRCHNDRGPVSTFMAKGCVGCHEDVHYGELGNDCASCHDENTWQPTGQIARHSRTRFPLVGAHAVVACHRCHPGTTVGNFVPTDNECSSCHQEEFAATTNPPHPAAWANDCDRCHTPIAWRAARF